MQRLRNKRALSWFFQGLLLLAMSPLGTVQCFANEDGKVSVELTINGVCLNCVSAGLECRGCRDECCDEAGHDGATIGADDQCGCVSAPATELPAVRNSLAAPKCGLQCVAVQPALWVVRGPSYSEVRQSVAPPDRRRPPAPLLITNLRI